MNFFVAQFLELALNLMTLCLAVLILLPLPWVSFAVGVFLSSHNSTDFGAPGEVVLSPLPFFVCQ